MITRQGIFSSLILFGGVLFSTWLAVKSTIFQNNDTNPKLIVGIGHGLKNWQMSETGFLKSVVTAQKMLHYADGTSDFFFVRGVYFDLNQPTNPPWNISADLGFALDNNRLLTLKNNVLITRERSSSSAALEIDTSLLNYNLDTNVIDTDKFVTLKEPELGNKTTAIGLRAYLNQSDVKLLKDIHTFYAPPVSPSVVTDKKLAAS